MNAAIETHCGTVLDSPYSRDRKEAMEELKRIFPGTGRDGKIKIVETLREVILESSSRDERELASQILVDCFEEDLSTVAPIIVETFLEVARDSKFSEQRLASLDLLRDIYPNLDEQYQEQVGRALAEIAGKATYEDERRRARTRLSDISREERNVENDGVDDVDSFDDAINYLGESLAEHLERSAHEGSKECLQRAEEADEFLEENPVQDESYDSLKEDIESLVEQLNLVPTGSELNPDRVERIENIAARIKRIYQRN